MIDNDKLPRPFCLDFIHEKVDIALKLCETPGSSKHEIGQAIADIAHCPRNWEAVPEHALIELRKLMALIEELRGTSSYVEAFDHMSALGYETLRREMVQILWLTLASIEQLSGDVGTD